MISFNNKKSLSWKCVSKSQSCQIKAHGLNLLREGAGREDIWESLREDGGRERERRGKRTKTAPLQLWVAPERKERGGGWKTPTWVNLPGESLCGFGRLHILPDDVWISSTGGWTRHLPGMVNRLQRRAPHFFHGKTLPAFLRPLVYLPRVARVCEITTDNFVWPAAQEKVSRTETGSAEIINGVSERCARPLSLWRLEGWRRLKDTKNRIRYCAG